MTKKQTQARKQVSLCDKGFNLSSLWVTLAAFSTLVVVGLMHTPHAVADEPAEQFVEALGENGYFDVAIDYLDGAAKDDLVDAEYRKRIPFEKAKILIQSISRERNADRREAKLNEADQLLSGYSAKLKDPDEKQEVVEIGANIKFQRAQSYINQSDNERVKPDKKKELLAKAQPLLESAREQYQQARAALRKRLESFKVDPKDPQSKTKRKRLQGTYIRIRTKLPAITELIGDTMSGPKQKKMYKEAVKENEDVYETYSSLGQVFVFDAAINGARAAQKADDHKKALEMTENVFVLGDGPAETRLKSKAMLIAADSWKATKPYPAEKAIEILEKPIGRLNRNELKSPVWQRLQVELANAQLNLAETLKSKPGGGNAAKARDLNRDASKLVRGVARSVGPYRDDAKALIEKYKLSFKDVEPDSEVKDIKTFPEAKDRGSEMITEIVDIQNEILAAQREGKPVVELQTELNEKADEALKLYDFALSLANDDTSRSDINFIHYQRILCYSFQNNPLKAAIIAEFLLDKYPNVDWSKQASSYIVSGYSSLLASAPADDRAFESEKLKTSCAEIARRWPGSDEAGRAASKMVEIAIKSGDSKTADEFYDLVPASSPSKVLLGSALAQRLWYTYRTSPDMPGKEKKAMLAKILKLLTDAIKQGGGNVNYSLANSSLTRADVLIEAKRYGDAIKQLENGAVAPLTLIGKNNPAIADPRYAERYRTSAYLSAVKAYLGAMGNGADANAMIKKATDVVSSLKTQTDKSKDPKAQARLTAVYQSVGKQLQDQFEGFETTAERTKLATPMASFLGTIEKQSKDSKTVIWAASTLLDAASTLQGEGADDAAKPLFKQAISGIDRAEKIGIPDPKDKLKVRRLRAIAQRGSGDFAGAVDTLGKLLEEITAVNVQIDAAETLQMWGKAKSDKSAYAKAMMGTGRYNDGNRTKNSIWGWRKLVQLTRGKDNLNSVYRESLYNSIKSRFEYGLLEGDAAKKKKAIDSAKNELQAALGKYPFLKEGVWAKKFDDLVKEMN